MKPAKILQLIKSMINGFHYAPSNILVDWLSAIVLTGWLANLTTYGEVMLARDIYEGFHSLSANAWMMIFGLVLISHLTSLFYRGKHAGIFRYISLVMATALWTFVSVNFMAFAPPNMATWTFGSLAFICFLLGTRIAWTSSYQHS